MAKAYGASPDSPRPSDAHYLLRSVDGKAVSTVALRKPPISSKSSSKPRPQNSPPAPIPSYKIRKHCSRPTLHASPSPASLKISQASTPKITPFPSKVLPHLRSPSSTDEAAG